VPGKNTGAAHFDTALATPGEGRGLCCIQLSGDWALYTNVGSKLFVTLGFVLPLHFIERVAGEGTRRGKLPVTLRATETQKIPGLNPL
jgi:hypothetical protein